MKHVLFRPNVEMLRVEFCSEAEIIVCTFDVLALLVRFSLLASEAFILVEETLSIVRQLIQFRKREIIHTGSLSSSSSPSSSTCPIADKM